MLHFRTIHIQALLAASALVIIIAPAQSAAKQVQLWDREITFEGAWGRMNQKADYLEWQKGMLYRRTTVLDKQNDSQTVMNLCVWSGGETCSPCKTKFFKKGDIVYSRTRPATWWKKGGKALTGWASQGIRAYLLHQRCGSPWMSMCGGSHCMKQAAAEHLPITVRVEEYYIDGAKEEHQFVCPEHWTNAPAEWNCYSGVEAHKKELTAGTPALLELKPAAGGSYRISAPGLKSISLHSVRGSRITNIRRSADGAFLFQSSAKGHSVIMVTGHFENGKTETSSFVVR